MTGAGKFVVWLRSRQAGQSHARSMAGRAHSVEVRADPVSQAQNWLCGRGDLLFAGLTGRIPLTVRLGVLAHADIGRLTELGRYCRRGSVSRAWGTEMAWLAGDIAAQAGTPERLTEFQRRIVRPLELDVLAGHVTFTSVSSLIRYLRSQLPAEPGVECLGELSVDDS